MTGLTRRQWELLSFITSFVNEHGYSPTFKQMAAGIGLTSTSSIARLVTALHERGCLRSIPNRARSICLTNAAVFLMLSHPRETVAA